MRAFSKVHLFFYIHDITIHVKNQAALYGTCPDVLRHHSPSLRQCRLPHIYAFNQLSIPSKSSFSISIYTPTPINRLQDYCSPIDKFNIISKFVKFIPNSCSHSSKQVRFIQTPDIPFGSSPRPRRHTVSPASRMRAVAPAGSATPQSFPERPRHSQRPMLPKSASRPHAPVLHRQNIFILAQIISILIYTLHHSSGARVLFHGHRNPSSLIL